MKTKTESVTKLKKKADAVFSKWIRERDKGVCFTCGKQDDPKYMQAGHFVSRAYNFYRFDERNVHCQCVGCNVFKNGNMVAYAAHFVDKYGLDTLKEFEKNRFKEKRFTVKELKGIIELYGIT